MTDATSPKLSLEGEAAVVNSPGSISRGYSVYIMAMFVIVSILSMADNYALTILMHPIQQDLGVSDTAMGLLVGAAWSLVFATAGIPLARVADTGNRRNLIAAAVAVWSTATMLCGAATSYVQLFMARVGVAGAEAGYSPAFMSMIGDMFPPARRGIAVATVMVGGSAGVVVGAVVAGAVATSHGWQTAFLVLGLPGVLFAFVFWLTVPEPIRGSKDGGVVEDADTATVLKTVRYIFAVPTAWRLMIASLLMYFGQAGWSAWLPMFFMRVHDMSLKSMSVSFGVFIGVSAVLAMIISSFVSDRLAKYGERGRIRFIAASVLLSIPFAIAAPLVPNTALAWVLVFGFQLCVSGAPPVIAAAGLGIVRPRARGMFVSLKNFAIYAVGGVSGPTLIGLLSDSLTDRFGELALRYSLLVVPVLLLPAALVFLWASRTADIDAERIRSADVP